jgi:hypothetical protein
VGAIESLTISEKLGCVPSIRINSPSILEKEKNK